MEYNCIKHPRGFKIPTGQTRLVKTLLCGLVNKWAGADQNKDVAYVLKSKAKNQKQTSNFVYHDTP